GRVAEWVAAGLLMLKGYRILARRVRTPYGELDLIAVRGNRLAFVEVKYRRVLDEAETAVSGEQASRIADAAEKWAWDHPAYRDHRFGLDAVYLAPWRMPRHLIDSLQPL
ncbi:MAG: YraN family protein, partial [Paracoccaceae bacterium]